MGRIQEDISDLKSQLVRQICSFSSRSNGCVHRRSRLWIKSSSTFIDWYLLLQVEETANVDKIRKQYRKLALQLHPDKNNHPKAELAFKLVSEAYACLTDESRRTIFDTQRSKILCLECKRVLNIQTEEPKRSKTLQFLIETKERMKSEAFVIEKCLKANKSSKEEGYPLFDPSKYVVQDYPHFRRTRICKQSENLRYLRTKDCRNYEGRRGRCESPLFEVGIGLRKSFGTKSACLSS